MAVGRKRRILLLVVLIGLLVITVAGSGLAVWLFQLDREIAVRFQQKRFAPPIEFYSAPELIRVGQSLQPDELMAIFARRGYRRREFGQPLQPSDASRWPGDGCLSLLPVGSIAEGTELKTCVAFRHQGSTYLPAQSEPESPPTDANAPAGPASEPVQIIAFGTQNDVVGTFAGVNPRAVESAVLDPELFAQYYGDKPTLRTEVNLGQIPPQCKDALLAIEDPGFLDHAGISFTGLIRAMAANLRHGRFAQGGSTITQQLVKNYFLTEEKTLKRKLTEIAMSFLVERRASKEDILETYLNLIYMGQNGPFEVRGFAAASQHYFGKPIDGLDLPECAMLAAVLNSPGMYNPLTKPEAATKRRTRVLEKMRDTGRIDAETATRAMTVPLPKTPARILTEPAPYFVKAVRKELDVLQLDLSQGLRVFTTLDLRAQEAAQKSVRQGLERLETTNAGIKKIKATGKNLEALLVASDPSSGFITAIVGGRSYTATQYNRAIESRRQVGSVMKPFVYLAAFEGVSRDGELLTPESTIDDSAYTIKYEGQTWSPKNYDGKFRGEVPLWFALVESLNASAARLAQEVGIPKVIDVARRLGITSRLNNVPSLALGAFELAPLEVLTAYTSLARLGSRVPLSTLYRVEDLGGHEVYAFRPTAETAVDPETTSILVGMLKNIIDHGSGRGARALGLAGAYAGKTGTTNDKKDSWFAGFSPNQAAVVWVGYDDNTPHGLTGGSGAVPIWGQFMVESQKLSKTAAASLDFSWPDGVVSKNLEASDLAKYPGIGDLVKAPVTVIERKPAKANSFFH